MPSPTPFAGRSSKKSREASCCAAATRSQMNGLALALVLGSASASFVVTEGDCVVNGACVSSPNYPEDYDDYTTCTFNPTTSGWLDVAGFDLHGSVYSTYCFDHLTVNDVQYCYNHGPQGVQVTSSTTMTFIADYYSGGHGGFSLCLSSSFTSTLPPPTPTPTIGECDTTATHFSVLEGNCTACGNCVYSPNHISGGEYGHYHDCTITPLQSGYLDVVAFGIEESSYWGCM